MRMPLRGIQLGGKWRAVPALFGPHKAEARRLCHLAAMDALSCKRMSRRDVPNYCFGTPLVRYASKSSTSSFVSTLIKPGGMSDTGFTSFFARIDFWMCL